MKFLLEKDDERKKKKRKKEAVDIENRNRHLIQLEVPTIIGPIPGSTRLVHFMWELVWLVFLFLSHFRLYSIVNISTIDRNEYVKTNEKNPATKEMATEIIKDLPSGQ